MPQRSAFLPARVAKPTALCIAISAAISTGIIAGVALAQQSTMPAIADSPTAQVLFDDLRMQAAENPVAAAKLARRLLDEYGTRVIRAAPDNEELFVSVVDATERFLVVHPSVLERFRELESRGAERMLREEGAQATSVRRRLTASGLRASLRLAEDALRSDRPLEAIAEVERLAAHPDLAGADALAACVIEASALRRLGRDDAARAVQARLSAIAGLPNDAVSAAEAAIGRAARGKSSVTGRSPLSVGADSGDAKDSWREVWSLELDQSLFRRVHGGVSSARRQQEVERARADATLMTAVPVVLDGRIFLSEGHRIRAVDLDSRDEIWTRELGSSGVERESGSIGDLSAISADRDALVVYEGHAMLNMRSAASRVWCLDPATGATRWNTNIDGCDGREELSGLFPVGEPLLVSDTVVVAARKPTQRLEQVDWLLGLDRRDGRLRWANSIAGSSGSRLSIGRRHAGLATDGAVVIESTPLGVVACVRASDGVISWLRRFPVPLRESRSLAEPWEAYTPAITPDRIITLTPDEAEVVALERSSGRRLDARPVGPETAWETPSYLVAAPPRGGSAIVLGVGTDIVAFDAADLSKRLWSFAESLRGAGGAPSEEGARAGIRGRVSIAGDSVVVPGVKEIVLLELATGRIRGRVPMDRPSNPVLLADRIVAAGDESLQVIMPPEQAESMLRKRLASTPDDPAAAIALMELAAATGRPAVALDAARLAERALARTDGPESLRAELLDKLDAFVAQNPDSGASAFEIAGSVANSAGLRVRVELGRGEFLRSNGRASEAVECWRRLASDPALGSQLVGPGGLRRQVRLEALSRIARLAARDRDISASIEAEATVARERLGTKPDRRALAGICLLHPRTVASAEAIAASTHLSDDEWLPLASAVIGDALVPPARAEVVDLVLAEVGRRSDDSAAFANRIAQLALASGLDRAPVFRDPRTLPSVGAQPVRGLDLRPRLVDESANSRLHRDQGMVLGLLEGALVRLAGPELTMQWRLRLDDREPQVQWANGRIVLWQRPPKGDSGALVVDPSSGALVYSTPRASELWPQAGGGALGSGAGAERAARIPALPSVISPLCDAQNLILVRRNGDLARIGFMDERPIAQTRRAVLEQVFAESLQHGVLAVAGRRSDAAGSRAVVALLDPRSLATRAEFEPISSSDVKWVLTTPIGEVFLGTRTAIERWAYTAEGVLAPTFVALTPESAESLAPVLLGSSLVTIDPEGRPTITPVFEGDQRALALGRLEDSQIVRSLEPLPQGLLVQSEDRFVLFSQSGERIGADSCYRDAQVALAVPVQGELLKVYSVQTQADGGRVRTDLSCIVERLSPDKGLRNRGEAFEVPGGDTSVNRALAIDGWLLLSHSQGTIAVAMPADPDQAKSGSRAP